MAIGDNIPGIFGGLAQSVIKADGPQYFIDLLNNEDADSNMALRTTAMFPDGAPPPLEGPLFDQFLDMTGNPDIATSMVIDDVISSQMPSPDMNQMKSDAASQQLYNMFPGTVDQGLINALAVEFDVPSQSLQQSYDAIDAETQLADAFLTMESGENFTAPMADMSQDIPAELPSERFIVPPEHFPPTPYAPPYDPSRISGIRELSAVAGEDPGAYPLEWAIEPTKSAAGATADVVTSAAKGLVGPWQEHPEGPMTGLEEQWHRGLLSPQELDDALENQVVNDMDVESQKLYAGGDITVVKRVNATVNELTIGLGDPNIDKIIEGSPEISAVDIDTAVAMQPAKEEWPGYISDEGISFDTPAGIQSPDPYSGNIVTGTSPPGFPATFTGLEPAQQFSTYMSSEVPSYYMPGMQQALQQSFQPTWGQYLLAPQSLQSAEGKEGFGDFLEMTRPQDYSVVDWSALSPKWDTVLDYVDAKKSGSPDAVEALTKNPSFAVLTNALTGTENRRMHAISLAMARYYQGQPTSSNTATRAVASWLTDTWDQQSRKSALAGTDATVDYLDYLATSNPDRFGR